MRPDAGLASASASLDAAPPPATAALARSELLPLTSLRFVAALWVFLFHINIWWPLGIPRPFNRLVEQGAVGMSLFFILSGFVLGYSYGQGEFSLKRYAWHRVARIYPVYTLAALVTLPFLVPPDQRVSLGQLAFIVGAHLLMLQAWFPGLVPYWNFGASWSLSVEAFFYALFPWGVRIVQGLDEKGWRWFMLGAWLLSVLPGLSYLLFPSSPPIYYSVPIFRLPEFALGVGCAMYFNRGGRIPAAGKVAALSVGVLVLFLCLVAPRSNIYVTANVVAVPAIALLILCLAQLRPPVLASAPLLLLGRASYAFYSLQPLVITSLIRWQRGQPQWPSWPVLAGAFVALTALSLLAFWFVEEPMRRWLARRAG